MKTPGPELERLFRTLLPPEEYGEDANVEEFYNRCTDLYELCKQQHEALRELIDPLLIDPITGDFYEEYKSSYYAKDREKILKAIEQFNKIFK